jgi:RNA polymerase sigma-70 factor, ECF subfamily
VPPPMAAAEPVPDARAARDARLGAHVLAAARGDAAAFESFYDATIGYAQAVAGRLLRAPADVEDLLADAYFEAWRNAPRFEPARGSAVTWLLQIVRSRALDALRRRAAEPVEPESAPPDTAADTEDPAEALWRCQAGSRLHAALAALSASERWVLGLAYFRDMSASQIASATGMPLGTVKTAILRGRHRLRAVLGPD